ncbi:TadE/TadG family type IV pilus assembly protein [Bradyrhizobium sp. JYMT SZCCT0180]|uniref:TadE/TadG family type IV pilus assembly protein n=1 Tax=Bradyrhizobium sp. JYMT SZCCT0180 TaxID=2807666 RepID=UPI001BA6761D|nr:TadE/TadG family type IV pilus assembly protein [Bradyrhizobium sp. JYMT SZCCT0180]MBR1215124.1 pilus assembly protein [Bradyrhizobium sp. JYMT SZCCT0180]
MPSHIRSFSQLLRRFRRNRGGSVVVEFAFVAPIFFALLFAIIETALMFFASQVLETVTQDSARMIMTGQAQNQQLNQEQFKAVVCGKVAALFDCNKIEVDVQSYTQFGSVDVGNQITKKAFTNPNNYKPGGAGDIVVVRLFYRWPILVTKFGYDISNLSDGTRLLTATAAFQNEPFN